MSTDEELVYWTRVVPDAPNNSHSYMLRLIGRNKRVLELGPWKGYFTQALVDQGCEVVGIERDPDAAAEAAAIAHRMVVGDLTDEKDLAQVLDDEGYDVITAGDVLEHLPDPLAVLRQVRRGLRRGGYVVLSLPNIAHADVKLQLLRGRFPYRDTGLLDRTHLHFFTLDAIEEMIRDAGLLLVDLQRVILPVFTTEQAVDRDSVSPEVLASVLEDPESEVYQFVVRAVVHDGDQELANLASRVIALQTDLDREQATRTLAEAELDEVRGEVDVLRNQVDDLTKQLDEAIESARGFEAHVEALQSTRSYRMMAPLRALFGRRGA